MGAIHMYYSLGRFEANCLVVAVELQQWLLLPPTGLNGRLIMGAFKAIYMANYKTNLPGLLPPLFKKKKKRKLVAKPRVAKPRPCYTSQLPLSYC
mmetsp:Transcript_13079/g.17231  ORF Transcript_13079/g.17231 Transcript_13079/m.17231 type:complete len:95 (-) Transcript_13079:212-496(-)